MSNARGPCSATARSRCTRRISECSSNRPLIGSRLEVLDRALAAEVIPGLDDIAFRIAQIERPVATFVLDRPLDRVVLGPEAIGDPLEHARRDRAREVDVAA